jgi:hypothetical protein
MFLKQYILPLFTFHLDDLAAALTFIRFQNKPERLGRQSRLSNGRLEFFDRDFFGRGSHGT